MTITATNPDATFDPAKHVYKRNGKRVPSVTTICAYAADAQALLYWNAKQVAACALDDSSVSLLDREEALRYLSKAGERERDEAGTRGTAAHDSLEYYLRHGRISKGLDEAQLSLVENGVRFVKDFGLEAVHIECPLFSDTYGYAGKEDWIGWCRNAPELGLVLGDWKTGSIVAPKFCAQMAAYAHAEMLLTAAGELIPMPEVRTALVIKITPDGYEPIPFDIGEVEFDAFLAAKRVYEHNLRCNRKDSPQGPPIPTPIVALEGANL